MVSIPLQAALYREGSVCTAIHACRKSAGSNVACLTGELLAEGSVRRSLRWVLSSLCCNSRSTKENRSWSTACISMMSAQQHRTE